MRIKLDIHKFTDYRVFLNTYASQMKKSNPNWSLGSWALALKLKTTSSITKILKGERDAGEAITEKLINYFKFNQEQAQYFRDLVRLQKIKKDPTLANILLDKIKTLKTDEISKDIDEEDYSLLSNWFYFAICEMTRSKSFKQNYQWIASKLIPKVPAEEIKKALYWLKKQDLLKTNAQGKLEPSYEKIYAINKKNSDVLKLYYSQLIQNSQYALLNTDPKERLFTSLIVHVNSKSIERAQQLIAEFRTRFEKLMYDDEGDQVYMMQIQLYPITKKLNGN